MKNRLWLFVALALVPFALLSCKPKAQAVKVTIATDATWPPMEFVNESKEIVGFDIDLMKAAAKAGGFAVEFKNTAWDGIFAGLANGEYDAVISSVTITDERKQTMDFSRPVHQRRPGARRALGLRRGQARRPHGQERGRPDRHDGGLRGREGQGRDAQDL